jgi:hypothetical protein
MPRPKGGGGSAKGSGFGPAKGAGWGGPAKGAGTRFVKGEVHPLQGKGRTAAVLADKAVVSEQMRQVLYGIALDGENDHARIAAADKLLDRLEGKPIARSDLTSGGEKMATFTIVTGVPRSDET